MRNRNEKTIYFVANSILCFIFLGCNFGDDIKKNKEMANHEQREGRLEESQSERSDDMENQEIEDQIDKNTELILSYLDNVSKYGIKGCVRRLQQLGCGELVKVEIADKEGYYALTLTDENDQEYDITLGYDGYLGIIKDKEGRYLYAPEE